jgi:hypothetical protein
VSDSGNKGMAAAAAWAGAWRGALATSLLVALAFKAHELATGAPGSGLEKGLAGVLFALLYSFVFSLLFFDGPFGALAGAVLGAARALATGGRTRPALAVCLVAAGLTALLVWRGVRGALRFPDYTSGMILSVAVGRGLWLAAFLVYALSLLLPCYGPPPTVQPDRSKEPTR